jgi:DNA-binding beta-propeller fold protein YncE
LGENKVIRYLLPALVALLAGPVLAQEAPQIKFTSVPNWPNLPNGQNFGEVPGVAVNSKGHVFVFSRSTPNVAGPVFGQASGQLFEFDADGHFIREVAKGLYGWAEPHSLRFDKEDNIWAIDKGSSMIFELSPAGRVMKVFGRRQEGVAQFEGGEGAGMPKPGEHLPAQESSFRLPTDIAWDSKGNIYITDGYVNSRVAKFDKSGDFVKMWGEFGTGDGQFRTPHSIVIDKNDNLYVGDRSNHRVQVFDTEGKFLRKFEIDVPPDPTSKAVNGDTPTGDRLKNMIGAPNSLCIPPDNPNVIFLGESTFPGRIFKIDLTGKVLGVIGRSGRNPGSFSGAHALACPTEHLIYVAETSNWRVQKLILQ